MERGIDIVPQGQADLRQLLDLTRTAFAGLPGWSDQWALEVLVRDIVFVARERGRSVGYVALRREFDGAITVEQLFVAPGHERHGIGRELLDYAEGYALAERARRNGIG